MKSRLLAVAFFLLAAGCQVDAPGHATPLGRVGPVPAKYAIATADLLAKYNANARRLAKLFVRTKVSLAWQEEKPDGTLKNREESGDGKLVFQAPASTVVTVEKLGKWYLWAGSDGKRYWLFDRTQNPSTLYVGQLGGPAAKRGFLGLPVHPQDVPVLLGLQPLNAAVKTDVYWCANAAGRGGYVVEQPGLRLLLHPDYAWPIRVELTDATGRAQVVAELSGAVVCKNGGVLREKAAIFPMNRPARLELTVQSAEADSNRIKQGLFDLEKGLVPANRPEKTVNLDTVD